MTLETPLSATSLRPYPEYRESGVSWLGGVPAHWEVRPTKRVFRHIVGGSTPKTGESRYWDGDVVWVTPSDVSRTRVLKSSARYITGAGFKSCSLELVPPDSIVLTSRAPVGNVAMAATSLCTNQGCKALIPKEGTQPQFYYFALTALKKELQARAVGTTFGEISTERLATLPLPVPPLDEQRAAARFLYDALGRIHRYVAAKERMIELLGEQKQAIIHRAVTPGLAPGVPLKPSGAEWLGDTPAHWRRVMLGAAAKSIQTGPFGSQLHQSDYVTGGVPVINPSHVVGGRIEPSEQITVTAEDASRLTEHRLRKGDLVIARRGEMGRCAVVTDENMDWICGTGSIRIRPDASVLRSPYLALVLRSAQGRRALTDVSIGTTMNNLSSRAVASVRILVPPVSEQEAIIGHLARVMKDLNVSVSQMRQQIQLVREYRSKLVVDVVTGKLDARGTSTDLEHNGRNEPCSAFLPSC